MAEQRGTPNCSDSGNAKSPLSVQNMENELNKGDEKGDEIQHAEIRVFGLGKEKWKTFVLYEASPGVWKTEGPIEVPPGVSGIRCVINGESKDSENEQIVSVECKGPKDASSDDAAFATPKRILHAQARLTVPWQSVNVTVRQHVLGSQSALLRQWGMLYNIFQHTGDLNDISDAIQTLSRALEMATEGDRNYTAMLNNLGNSFLCRFERVGNVNDLSETISLLTRAVCHAQEGHKDLSSTLGNLGNSLRQRFKLTGELSDLTEAISVLTRAVDLIPDGHVHKPGCLHNLGNSYLAHFERTGDLSDVANAISRMTEAVYLTPDGDADLPNMLMSLGSCFECRFERTDDLADITESISLQARAVRLTPEGDINLPIRLLNLGSSFLIRFERTGDLGDVAESISLRTRAVRLTPADHANLPIMLMCLGVSFLKRFGRTGDLGDIAETISLQSQAVRLTPDGHAEQPGRLMNLGVSFLSRFERTSNLDDLAESIALKTRAVRLTPAGHARLPRMLDSLGCSLRARFERTRNLSDINEAISMEGRAVSLTPSGHAARPGYLCDLGQSFRCRFELTCGVPDIAEAISLQTQAVELTPDLHAGLPRRLCDLGNSLQVRFEHTGDLSDITEAVTVLSRAVDITPEGHPLLPSWHTNLGNAYMRRFVRTNDSNDVEAGTYNLSEAVRLTPETHANQPAMLINLASALYKHFNSSQDQRHLVAAMSNYRSAATFASGSPRNKIAGARLWASLCTKHPLHLPGVLTAFEGAINLLVVVVGLEETVDHRYTTIEGYGELPVEAAAAAIRQGAVQKALEWLEQGRCLVWGQQSRLRTPLHELKARNEVLANRVKEVSNRLETIGSSRQHSGTTTSWGMKVSLEDEALEHSQLATEWDRLLEDVRTIPGFETFLQPFRCAAILQDLPASGIVVILNAHEDRCDALVLRAGFEEVLHLPLPKFTLRKARQYRRTLAAQLRSHGLRVPDLGETLEPISARTGRLYRKTASGDVHAILKGLWEEVVKPILGGLNFSKRDGDTIRLLPRVWWCPTGPVSFLPLHAAGIYKGGEAEGVADYVVSSYTPSVTALTQRVKGDSPISEQVSGLFLTCQPNAPGAPPILETIGEVSAIYSGAEGLGVRASSLSGDDVTAKGCLEYMEEYSSIHLACHGVQDTSDPLRSRFLFHKGKLHLNSIMQKNLPNADLAYLSACQTSAGQDNLPDEVVHLAAGMLAAGYRRVVSTMWEIGDRHAPQVASDFYKYLWDHRPEGSGSCFDGSLSAYALHHATQQLRGRLDNTDRSLLAWMPFVHYGY